jgi:hypothetical protein
VGRRAGGARQTKRHASQQGRRRPSVDWHVRPAMCPAACCRCPWRVCTTGMWLADERAQLDAAACGRWEAGPCSGAKNPPVFSCLRHPSIRFLASITLVTSTTKGLCLRETLFGRSKPPQAGRSESTFHFVFKQVGLPICFKTTPQRVGQLFAQQPALVCARTHCPLHSYLQPRPASPRWPATPPPVVIR